MKGRTQNEDRLASAKIELANVRYKLGAVDGSAKPEGKDAGGIVVVNMARDEYLPRIKEEKRSDWVKYGKKNDFPEKVIEWANASPIHSAIIKLKADRIAGDGFVFDEETAAIDHLIEAAAGDDLEEVFFKAGYDYTEFGGFYLNAIWDATPGEPQGIAELHYLDFKSVRSGKADDRGNVGMYYVCRDWKNAKKKGNEPKKYPAFSKTVANDPNKRSQIIAVRRHAPGTYYYPIPDYAAAIKDIIADGELQNFRLCNIKNGFLPSTVVSIPGDPGPEMRKEVKNNLKEEFGGTDAAGRFMLLFSPNPEYPVTVTPLDNKQNSGVYRNQSAEINQNIFSAHRLSSPVIAGIPGAGSLGGNASEIREANEAFHNSVIKRYQKDVLKAFRKVFRACGYTGGVTIDNSDPVEFKFSETVLLQILSADELRELIGYAPKEEEVIDLTPAQLANLLPYIQTLLSKNGPEETRFTLEESGVEFSLYPVRLKRDKVKFMGIAERPAGSRARVVMSRVVFRNGYEVFIDDDTYEAFYVIDGDDRAIVVPDGDYETENGAPISIRDGVLVTGSAGAIYPPDVYFNRYEYKGPTDSKNRDFCRNLLNSNRTYSIYEIQAMSAERGYDVFNDAGGANCRHYWEKV